MTDELMEKRSKELFAAMKSQTFSPSPYLRTRVLAQLRERQAEKKVQFWRRLGILSPVLSIVLVAALYMGPRGTKAVSTPAEFQALINQKVAVRVQVEPIQNEGVAFAEIELPEGVQFYSEKYPELKARKTLTLAWDETRTNLPLIIQAQNGGEKMIRVRFLNGQQRVLRERDVRIAFKGAA